MGFWVFVLSVAAACGGAGGAGASTEREAEAPPTHHDPPPYIPSPAAQAHTGEVSALATAGGHDQARAVAIELLVAVRDSDEETLTRLISDPVGRVLPRLSAPNRGRDTVLRQVLSSPQRTGLGPDVELDALIDRERMTVTPLSRLPGSPDIPDGLLGSDLLVRFPLAATGRQQLRFVLSWAVEGAIVVRPGSEPRVIAL
jgi:hypothetical protein